MQQDRSIMLPGKLTLVEGFNLCGGGHVLEVVDGELVGYAADLKVGVSANDEGDELCKLGTINLRLQLDDESGREGLALIAFAVGVDDALTNLSQLMFRPFEGGLPRPIVMGER